MPVIANVLDSKLFATDSVLSAAYPLQGWLPAVRFIPCKGYAADKTLARHERLESADPCVTRLTGPVKSSLSYYRSVTDYCLKHRDGRLLL